jgi:hypothetical protein
LAKGAARGGAVRLLEAEEKSDFGFGWKVVVDGVGFLSAMFHSKKGNPYILDGSVNCN